MTAEERFEKALQRAADTAEPSDVEACRSAHAACVEEARREEQKYRDDQIAAITSAINGRLAEEYERGLREGAELENEQCAFWAQQRWPSDLSIAATIRARSKGGDAPGA